jgi:hypothetical protein
MQDWTAALWVNARPRVVRRLPLRSRFWLRAVRDAHRHNVAIRRADPATSALCFYPERPHRGYAIFHVAGELGLRVVRSRRGRGLLTVAWRDATFVRSAAVASLPTPTLNARCLDISKSTVDRLWHEVSRRGLSLDPFTTSGPMVAKSERNGMHDGRILSGPLRNRRPGVVYQRLVDNRQGDDFVWMRPVILGGRIVLIYHKSVPLDDRFSSRASPRTRLAEPDSISPDETDSILELAARIGVDYGEMDVLRDADGALYVVDVNKTPVWPANMDAAERAEAYRQMAAAFSDLIYGHHGADR